MKAKNILIIVYLILKLITPNAAEAKGLTYFNVGKYSGLPSNHAYYSFVDRLGYLWIATDKGVARYNGYEYKIYDLSCGMTNNDVWSLFEDNKGRIWFSSISSEIGYVFNGQYKKAYINEQGPLMYPTQFWQSGNLVNFSSKYDKYNFRWSIYAECGNSFNIYLFRGWPILNGTKLYTISNDSIFGEHKKGNKFQSHFLCTIDTNKKHELAYSNQDSFLIYYYTGAEKINVLNLNTYMKRELNFCNQHISIAYFIANKLFVTTNKFFYIYDKRLNFIYKYCFKNLSSITKITNNMLSISHDHGWKDCICTANNGVIIDYGKINIFDKPLYNLENYSYIGTIGNNCFWWNKIKRELAKINSRNKITYYKYNRIYDMYKIIPFSKDTALLFTSSNIYYCNYDNVHKNILYKYEESQYSGNYIDMIPYHDSVVALNTLYGIAMLSGDYFHSQAKNIYPYRFKNITYDSVNDAIWGYSSSRIVIYKNNHKVYILNKNLLNSIGLTGIEKIFVDKRSGDVFFKNYNKLTVYNFRNHTYKELLKEYVLINSSVCFYKGMLIVAGKFGIAFSKITEDGNVEAPILFENVKNANYRFVTDIVYVGDHILLNTDNGLYTINIPKDNYKRTRSAHLYKFNLSYNNVVKSIKSGDTLQINPKNQKLSFDIVNPAGNGLPQYAYFISGINYRWQPLGSNELYIPKLNADRYYTLFVTVHDDIWRSHPVKIYIHIIPYWWQKTTIRPLLIVLFIITILVLFAVIVYVTQRIVSSKNKKKNVLLELELKFIYAQINPHFIFNTLSTALYFIKKKRLEDAVEHVSTFSDLLRAYLKSSTNKYITIGDEIVNLRNYIELQSKRFDGKFDYSISVDDPLTERISVPSLLLQPLVENAITHGLFHKQDKGYLKIEFSFDRQEDELICTIEDDGIGRKASKIINESSTIKRTSYGNDLIKSLISIFNKYEQTNIRIEYIDKEAPLTGTIVRLRIKDKRWQINFPASS